jgi:REP element-mobilizing transposase RayT
MSKVQNITHIVINTKNRRMTITESDKKQLYNYMWGIMKNMNCQLLWMNGIPNHIHILVDIHPEISVSKFVQTIKSCSSKWLKQSELFPYFDGWGREYCAFSKSRSDVEVTRNYIKNQEEHHRRITYEDEMTSIMANIGYEWHPEYFD